MRELGLTGLSEDGRFLVAHDALTEEQFRIPTDIRLTSLLGASSAGAVTQPDREAGTRETTMEVALSPRDIQARIRRGESPEQVAEQSGMPVDKVRGFAVPVLAEREFIVEQARKTSVRRLHSTGTPGMLLGSLVDTGLAAAGASAEAATWDSWRREDGRWTVVVAPDGALEPVTFLFDVKGRYVLPADDAAHELIGDVVQDVLNATPDMALANAVREEAPATAPPSAEEFVTRTVEVIETVEVVETVEVTQSAIDDLPNFDEVPYDLPAPDAIIEISAPVSSLKEARDRRALEQLALAIDSQVEAPSEASDVEITEEQNLAVPSTPHPSSQHPSQSSGKKRHERRRVPSWDEIMFGTAQHD